MTAQEHANAIWRAEPSPEALAGAISAYTDELRGELHKLKADHAAEVERLKALIPDASTGLERALDTLASKEVSRLSSELWAKGRTIDALAAENAALKEEVESYKVRYQRLIPHTMALVSRLSKHENREELISSLNQLQSELETAPDDLTTARARIAELEGLLRRVLKTVDPDAMFERGEDPHPPSVLEDDIEKALSTKPLQNEQP